jgi:hypothetical protein
MQKLSACFGHWLPFYSDERQTNSLFAHERVKIATPCFGDLNFRI